MKVACVGGGPAGLYLSILLKRQDPSHDITVHERHPEGSTYGWGVTCWRGLYDRLHEQDPESARALDRDSVRWSEGVAHVRDLTARHSGDQGHGIGRHWLLEILAARARPLGVRLEYEREITAEDLPADADRVVAADGVRSALRTRHSAHFGMEVAAGRNRNWSPCAGSSAGSARRSRGTCTRECRRRGRRFCRPAEGCRTAAATAAAGDRPAGSPSSCPGRRRCPWT